MKYKARKRHNSKKSETRQNSSGGMFGDLFGMGMGYSTGSPASFPFQLGVANQYTPLSLNRILLSYAYMTFGIIQTFIDQPVEDGLRGGVDIECDELDEADIQLLQDAMVELKDYEAVKDAAKWAKLYGGSGLIINTNQDPMTELDIDAIGEDSPLSLIAADRWELTLAYLAEDRNPVPYNYYGQSIHKSRVLKILGKQAPSFIRRRLQGWGMSELERVIRDVNSYVKNQDVIYELLDEAKQDIWQIEKLNTSLMTPNGQAQINKRLEMANVMKNYSSALVMDKNDGYEQKQISFGGLAEIQNQNRIGVAGAVRMPITRLFGQSATGFNSGEEDTEIYNSLIESEVRAKLRDPIHMIVKLRCQQLFGFVPEHFDIKFKPLRTLTAEQEENIKDKKFNRSSALYSQGMLTPKEYAEMNRKDGITPMDTEVSEGIRDPEPPQSAMGTDMPQDLLATEKVA